MIYHSLSNEMKNKLLGELRALCRVLRMNVKHDELRLCLFEMLIWFSCTMITLIYVPKPALHKSAKANNCTHNPQHLE